MVKTMQCAFRPGQGVSSLRLDCQPMLSACASAADDDRYARDVDRRGGRAVSDTA